MTCCTNYTLLPSFLHCQAWPREISRPHPLWRMTKLEALEVSDPHPWARTRSHKGVVLMRGCLRMLALFAEADSLPGRSPNISLLFLCHTASRLLSDSSICRMSRAFLDFRLVWTIFSLVRRKGPRKTRKRFRSQRKTTSTYNSTTYRPFF